MIKDDSNDKLNYTTITVTINGFSGVAVHATHFERTTRLFCTCALTTMLNL